MKLGETIRVYRQKAFCTQADFAREINVSTSTVNRWEMNRVYPSVKAMKAIKEFCSKHSLPFDPIEEAWISDSVEDYNA